MLAKVVLTSFFSGVAVGGPLAYLYGAHVEAKTIATAMQVKAKTDSTFKAVITKIITDVDSAFARVKKFLHL